MSGVVGNIGNLKQLRDNIRRMPTVVGQRVAARGAPAITGLAQRAYASGDTVYGDARPVGVAGNALSLVRTGTTRSTVRFSATGTILRAVLSTRYAKYLIGKYRILPAGNAALPVTWSARLREIVGEEIPKQLGAT